MHESSIHRHFKIIPLYVLACLGPIQFLGDLCKVKLHKPRDKLVKLQQNEINQHACHKSIKLQFNIPANAKYPNAINMSESKISIVPKTIAQKVLKRIPTKNG